MADLNAIEHNRLQDQDQSSKLLQEPGAPYDFVDDLPTVKNYQDLIAWQ